MDSVTLRWMPSPQRAIAPTITSFGLSFDPTMMDINRDWTGASCSDFSSSDSAGSSGFSSFSDSSSSSGSSMSSAPSTPSCGDICSILPCTCGESNQGDVILSSDSDEDDITHQYISMRGTSRSRLSPLSRSASRLQLANLLIADAPRIKAPEKRTKLDNDGESDEEDGCFVEDVARSALLSSRRQYSARKSRRQRSWLKLLSTVVNQSSSIEDNVKELGLSELSYTHEEEDTASLMVQLSAFPEAPYCHEVELPPCGDGTPAYHPEYCDGITQTRTVSHSGQYLMVSLENVMMQRRKIRSPLRDRAYRSAALYAADRTSRLRNEVCTATSIG